MKYVNKTTAIISIFLCIFIFLLFPEEYQGLAIAALFSLLCFIGAILIYKFKCVNLIAGVETKDNPDVEKQAKYGGLLMIVCAMMLLIAVILFFINRSIYESAYMIILAIPIIFTIPYCIYKMNQ